MKLLLISEQKTGIEQISRIIKNQYKDLELIIANSKEQAINYASVDGPFGFYVLDAEAKEFDPDELGKELLDFTGNRPIIFLGHEAFIIDRISQELYNSNEYNERILRPFEREDFKDDIINKVSHALVFAKKEEYEQSIEEVDPEDFIQMKIKAFYLYNSFPHDIYMEITPTKYLKVISANKPFTVTTLSTYAKKNVRHLHIRKDDQLEYLETESKKCLKAIKKVNIKSNDMVLVLLRSITIIHQTLLAVGVTPTVLTLSNTVTDTIIEMIKRPIDLIPIVDKYPNVYAGIASKSLLTGFISIAMSSKMGLESLTTKKKLGISAILMDFPIQEEEMAAINAPNDPRLKMYTEEQVENFLQHPIKAAEVAQQFTTFPDIDFLIEHHHETPTRRGFPNQPSHTKLTALCSVFNVAQFIAAELDGEILSSPMIAKTLRALSRDYNQGNFKEALTAAKEILKAKS